MPYSVFPKLPAIWQAAKNTGIPGKERINTTANNLRLRIIEVTGSTSDKSVKNIKNLLVDFGYIRTCDGGLTYDLALTKPYEFYTLPSDEEPTEEEANKKINELLGS